MSNPIKKLAGQTAVYGLSSIVGRLLNYLLVPLYTSKYVFKDPSDYGVVAELYAWVAFFMVLLTFGMETAYFKFLNDREDKKHVFNSSFLSVLLVNGAFLILLLIFHQPIAEKMLFGDHPEYIIFLGIIVTIDAVSALPLAKLRAEERAKKFAIIQLTSIGVNIGLNLFLLLIIFDKENPAQAVQFILIANILASLIKPSFLYKDFLQIVFKLDFTLVRAMIRYSFPLALAGFAFIINETIDRVLLKHLTANTFTHELGREAAIKLGEAQVGIYSASYKLAMLVTIFLQAYRYAAEPFFFAQAKDENRNKTYVKVMNYFVGAVFLCFLGVSLNLDIFKYFIPNPNFWEGLKVVPILLLANVFLGIYINQSIWYKLSGQTRFGAYIAMVGAIFTVVLNVLFIPIYGYIACAWVTFSVYGGQMVASYLLGQKHYPIPYNLRKFVLFSAVALIFYFVAHWMNLSEGWTKIAVHNLFVVVYIALIWYMEKPLKKKDDIKKEIVHN
jgi:O-antigen/teichoic acid export membrane protein